MNTFQIVVVSIFGAFILFGLVAFATFKGSSSGTLPTITVWGTISASQFDQDVSDTNATLSTKITVNYVEKDAATFNNDLINAIADGKGPDVIELPQDLIAEYQNKIYPLPYTSYSLSKYETTYVDEARLYTTSAGILAFPFTMDPLVMYWNRDLLASAGMATPPQYWDQFSTVVPKLTEKDSRGDITQSGVALGEYSNVTDAKAILSGMLLEVGNQIVSPNPDTSTGALYESVLDQDIESGTTQTSTGGTSFSGSDGSSANASNSISEPDTASESVLRFYTEFSNPSGPTYSWNSSILDSQDDFLAGNLALYFGFASELPLLQSKNPNLNFDIAMLPQLRGTKTVTTFGNITGFAVLKSSQNINAAFQTVYALTSPTFVSEWTKDTGLVSTLRSVVATPPASDPNSAVLYSSALVSKGWLDPDPAQTDTIFATMINSIISEGARLNEALQTASDSIQSVILNMPR